MDEGEEGSYYRLEKLAVRGAVAGRHAVDGHCGAASGRAADLTPSAPRLALSVAGAVEWGNHTAFGPRLYRCEDFFQFFVHVGPSQCWYSVCWRRV